MGTVLRIFLPLYFIVYLATAFLWRSYLTWKRTGINPYALGRGDGAHDLIGRLFGVAAAACLVVVAVFSFWPKAYSYFAPLAWMEGSAVRGFGIALMVVSLLWTLLAQAQMGRSWRIGIDTAHRTELIRSGVYRFSRNPIFLGMRVTLLGFFLALPNAITLAILAGGDAFVQIQVRLEEEFLTKMHGERYEEYRRQTRRWI